LNVFLLGNEKALILLYQCESHVYAFDIETTNGNIGQITSLLLYNLTQTIEAFSKDHLNDSSFQLYDENYYLGLDLFSFP
jgi:hypothetical protein